MSLPSRQPLLLLLATAGGLLAVACGDPDPGGSADGGVGPLEGQGAAPRGPLAINELSPKPLDGPDWIELFNRSDEAVDLCDYFLSDSVDRLDHYLHLGGAAPPAACEPQLLEAGDYLIVHASDHVELGPSHAPFKLGRADELHLINLRGESEDSLIYLFDDEGLTLSRLPNGEGLFFPAIESAGSENPSEEEAP